MRDGSTRRRRRRSVSTGAVSSAWPLLRRPRPWDIDIASRRTLEDPIGTIRHPLAVVIAVSAIIVAGGFFLRLPHLPGLSSSRL